MPPTEVRVRARPRREFVSTDFDPQFDKFKNAIVVPTSVFDRLFPDGVATGYVHAAVPGGEGQPLLLYVLQFSDAHTPAERDTPAAYLRVNRQRVLGLDEDGDREIELTPVDAADTGPLRIVRYSTLTESTRTDECRLHPDVLDGVGVDDGDAIEIYNPTTGGRILLDVTATPDMEPGTVSLSTRARKLLQADFEERADERTTTVLHARRPIRRATVDDHGHLRRLRDRLLDWSVGYHEARLRVNLGINVDEGRSAARINPDTMDVLGIDDGDRVVVSSPTDRTRVRVHSIEPDSHYIETDSDFGPEDVRDRTILLPATEREAADALCHDVVRVRRDTGHVAVKSVVPSLFGFLGVFVGGLQTVDLLWPPEWRVHGIVLTFLLSLSAIWFVLWPERQRCQ